MEVDGGRCSGIYELCEFKKKVNDNIMLDVFIIYYYYINVKVAMT